MGSISVGLPIIVRWAAKCDGGEFYAVTSSNCGLFYLDMGGAGTAHFVKPGAAIVAGRDFQRRSAESLFGVCLRHERDSASKVT